MSEQRCMQLWWTPLGRWLLTLQSDVSPAAETGFLGLMTCSNPVLLHRPAS